MTLGGFEPAIPVFKRSTWNHLEISSNMDSLGDI